MKKLVSVLAILLVMLAAASCSGTSELSADNTRISAQEERILIAYFSRVGNTEYPEDVDATTSASLVVTDDLYGTTEYVARLIQREVGGDLHLIRTRDPYPVDFDDVRSLNHREAAEGYLPPLAESDLEINDYDIVFLGYPVWASDTPQAVLSFLSEYDFSGKTVIPFCTHAGYGAGRSFASIRSAASGAAVLEGVAIHDEAALSSAGTVTAWLEELGIAAQSTERDISIIIGDITLAGVLYDSALASEIAEAFPLTVDMVNYGSRELYGPISFRPQTGAEGQLYFEDGDITYCPHNNTLAIFYSQSSRPNLTMEVIPIGHVTSDLSLFSSVGRRAEITFSFE